MEIKKLLKDIDGQLSSKVVAGVLTTESALTGVSQTMGHDANPEDVKQINAALSVMKDVEEKLTKESGDTGTFVGAISARMDDIQSKFNNIELTKESGSGSEISLAAKSTLMINTGRTNQDAFAEEFFPSILSPDMNQIKLQYTIAAYIKDWKGSNKELLAIHDTLVDTSYLQGSKHKLIPAYAANSEYLNTKVKYNLVNGLNTIETAPYKFGTKIDIIDACIDEVNSTGSINNVRTIAPNVKLAKLFFSNGETDAALYGTADERKFSFETISLFGSAALPTINGKIEDIQISFGVDKVYELPLSSVVNGGGVSVYGATYPNAQLLFEVVVKGDGNLTKAQFKPTAPEFKIVGVKNNGVLLAKDDSAYTAIATALADVKVAGYELDVYEANGDVVNEGNLLTLDNESETYPIGYKQPLTVKGPIASLYNDKTDLATLAQFITHSGDKASVDGKTVLLNALAAVKVSTDVGSSISGIGNKFIKPVVITEAVNVATAVNNMETTNLENSVRATLLNTIKTVATKMFVASKYKAVFDRFYQNRKMRLSVGIDQRLQTWLPVGKHEISGDFDCYVVSTVDNRFDGKMVMAFTSSASDRNKEMDILGLGFCAYDTTVVTQVRKQIGGSTVDAVMAFPKYEHIITCTIFGEVEVSGLTEVFIG
jgi:hypothetical protein